MQQALTSVNSLLDELDLKHEFVAQKEGSDANLQYYFYKLIYFKVKVLRKLRMINDADTTAQFLVDTVTELMDSEHLPQEWWKFGFKAAYVRNFLLA